MAYLPTPQSPFPILPFVGRTEELEKLKSIMNEAAAKAHGRLVFVSGEAGVGKTRLALELQKHAASIGVRCLNSKSYRVGVDSSQPYRSWVEFISRFSEEASFLLFSRVCGPSFNEIIDLVPELARFVAPSHSTRIPHGDQNQFEADSPELAMHKEMTFLSTISGFFSRLAAEAPLLLVMDDLQWCDPASLKMLRFIAQNLKDQRILILGLYRSEDLENLPDDLSKKEECIMLKRLNQRAVQEMLGGIFSKISENENLFTLIQAKTGGNPFFVQEVLRTLIDKKEIYQDQNGDWIVNSQTGLIVPQSIQNLIRQRAARLDEKVRDVLRTASVIGEQFSLDILRSLSSKRMNSEEVMSAIGVAVQSGLIEEKENSPSIYYNFPDESIRDVFYEEIPSNQLKELHRLTAKSLEKYYSREGETTLNKHADLLAYQFLLGDEKSESLKYWIKAAEDAVSVHAHQNACNHYRSALSLMQGRLDQDQTIRRAELLEKLGIEEFNLGDVARASESWNESARLFEKGGQTVSAGRLYTKIGLMFHLVLYDESNTLDYYERATELLEGGPESPELAYLYLCTGTLHYWKNEYAKAIKIFRRSASLAAKFDNYHSQAISYQLMSLLSTWDDKVKAIQYNEVGFKVANEHHGLEESAFAYFHRAVFYARMDGPTPQALQFFRDGIEYTSKTGQVSINLFHKSDLVHDILVPRGDLEEALSVANELIAATGHYPVHSVIKLLAYAAIGVTLLEKGDLNKSEEYLASVQKETHLFGPLELGVAPYTNLGRLYLERKDYSKAEQFIKQGYEIVKKRGLTIESAIDYIEILSGLVEIDLKQGKDASRFMEEFRRLTEIINKDWARAFLLRSEGRCQMNQEEKQAALKSLRASSDLFERLGWRIELIRTLHELGIAEELTGDYESANSTFDRAILLSKQAGAKIYEQKCLLARKKTKVYNKFFKKWHELLQEEDSRITFELLMNEFRHDYSIKRLSADNSGWRTLSDLVRLTKLPRSKFYESNSRGGTVFKELIKSGLIETRIYAGERGRGGNVLKIRVSFGNNDGIRDYLESLT